MKEFWPNDTVLNEANFNMVFVNFSETDPENIPPEMYFINAQEKTKIPPSALESDAGLKKGVEDLGSQGYQEATYGGKKVCIVLYNLPKGSQSKYEMKKYGPQKIAIDHIDTLYHESFHFYVQEKSWGKAGSTERDQVYPVDFKPRTYRILANLALINAYDAFDDVAKRQQYYSQAKYWLNKYESECAKEADTIKLNDINEGTANYFGKAVCNSVFKEWDLFERPNETDNTYASTIDGESYSIGSISICLLKREGRLNEAVSCFKKDAYSPINLLLKDVTSTYDEAADTLLSDLKAKIATAQINTFGSGSATGKAIEEAITLYKSGNATYLVDFDPGTSSGGTYKLTDSEMDGCNCLTSLGITSKRTQVTDITALEQRIWFPSSSGSGAECFIMPISGMTFIPDEQQPAGESSLKIGYGSKPSGESIEAAGYFTNVKKGKISALISDKITLKEYAKTIPVFEANDAKGNKIYIFEELSKESEKPVSDS